MFPYQLVDAPIAPSSANRAGPLAQQAWQFHQSFPPYRPTPCRRLDTLAATLGVAELHLKDESPRFGLNAFKGLGPSFAMHRHASAHGNGADTIFTTASDGNHGRAVAWMARQLNARCVVYLPAHTVAARIRAIENEGAKVVMVADGYDAAVLQAKHDAALHGWVVIQDSATAEYFDVPEAIAAGYWTMARELETSLHPPDEAAVDLVILHAGVGTWPAALVDYYWHRYGARRPRIVVVEPRAAACVMESVQAGHLRTATGSQRTIMAGLNCGLPSTVALETLRQSVDAFIAIDDSWTETAMRALANPVGDDPVVISGESGAAGVAGLFALLQLPELAAVRDHLQLGATTRVLAWSTEGATDPVGWERVVGRSPQA